MTARSSPSPPASRVSWTPSRSCATARSSPTSPATPSSSASASPGRHPAWPGPRPPDRVRRRGRRGLQDPRGSGRWSPPLRGLACPWPPWRSGRSSTSCSTTASTAGAAAVALAAAGGLAMGALHDPVRPHSGDDHPITYQSGTVARSAGTRPLARHRTPTGTGPPGGTLPRTPDARSATPSGVASGPLAQQQQPTWVPAWGRSRWCRPVLLVFPEPGSDVRAVDTGPRPPAQRPGRRPVGPAAPAATDVRCGLPTVLHSLRWRSRAVPAEHVQHRGHRRRSTRPRTRTRPRRSWSCQYPRERSDGRSVGGGDRGVEDHDRAGSRADQGVP